MAGGDSGLEALGSGSDDAGAPQSLKPPGSSDHRAGGQAARHSGPLSEERKRKILGQLFFEGEDRKPYIRHFFILLTLSDTLDRGWGSCRDLAVLFAEAARSLGFGARLVSGYLFNSDDSIAGSSGPGSTHAWAEVYVPGAGWITFDPTNRSVGGFNLIPVAGSFVGMTDAFSGMSVEVSVTA